MLYGEAALLFAAAAVVARTGAAGAPPLRAEDVLGALRALEPPDVPAGMPARAPESLLAGLSAPDRLVADRVDPTRATALAEDARAAARWLAALVEPRSAHEIALLRRFRVVTSAFVALAVLSLPAMLLLRPRNVALHKPVTLSANHPQSISPPSGLTDGITSGAYGAETTVSVDPWVQVDLERRYAIDKVKVYNRGDAAFDAGMPMTLQCSEDGVAFATIETRRTSFSQKDPWVAHLSGRPCRYVRVHGARGTYVALSEIEVYGRSR